MSDAQNDPKVVHLREPAQQQQVVVDASFLDQVVRATTQMVEARSRYVSPFNLNSMDEIVLFAEHTAKSGLCPKAYKDKPADIISAVIFGKEVGLSAMSSLTSIAMIEGQPQLWGPAVAGVCLQTGQVADHTYAWEGEGDQLTAICVVTRKWFSPIEGRFSQRDAQQAGLLSRAKDGMPWKAYARDMLMWKASHRAWRQAFPDVIKGLGGEQPPSQEPGLEGWPMPRPEVRWRAMRPKLDEWDPKWHNDACERLRLAADTREWMVILAELLNEAPSLRDVDELHSWDMTTAVVGTIPADKQHWRQRVEEVFDEARKRFEKPAEPEPPKTETEPPKTEAKRRRTTPSQEKPADPPPAPETTPPPPPATAPVTETASFDWPILDEIGEPIGETMHSDPVAWARTFMQRWEKSPNQLGLEEQNADALDEAIKLSEEAASLLAEMQPVEMGTVPMPLERGGKPNTIAYLRDLKNDMAALTPEDFTLWVDLQRAVIMAAPQSTKLLAIKAITQRAGELGVAAPNGWNGTATAAPAAAPTAAPAASASAPATASGQSKDDKLAQSFLEHLDTLNTEPEVNAYSGTGAVRTVLDRWRAEDPPRYNSVVSAFHQRNIDIRARAGASTGR